MKKNEQPDNAQTQIEFKRIYDEEKINDRDLQTEEELNRSKLKKSLIQCISLSIYS